MFSVSGIGILCMANRTPSYLHRTTRYGDRAFASDVSERRIRSLFSKQQTIGAASGRMRSQPEFGVSFVNPAAEGIAFVKVFERQIDDSGRGGQSLKSVQIKFLPCPSDRTNADDVEHRQREEDHRCGFQITLCAGFQSERI